MIIPEVPVTERWYPLIAHPEQVRLMNSPARFAVVPAGRRSGKTERAKRKLVRSALVGTKWPDAHFFAGAPTRDQAKRLYWDDLKKMIHPSLVTDVRESELIIKLINNSSIHVLGMDKPERIEGSPWDGGVLDEYANMKKQAWSANVRPALSDRKGWCWLIGVPEGRNHYYELYEKTLNQAPGFENWDCFTWKTEDILPEEAAAARLEMDELTYQQEYEASFVNFQGRVYYTFERHIHCSEQVKYNPRCPLIFCFDFNVSPGVAAVLQEQPQLPNGLPGTAIIGEVYIPRNSNTPAVCRKLIQDWGQHAGEVHLYGDATGGSSGTAKVAGSDWDLIRKEMRPIWGERLRNMVPASNPLERIRVNSVNSRLMANKIARVMINGQKCPHVVQDLEGVRCLEGGSGEIDKDADQALSHISDAIGYYFVAKYPIGAGVAQRSF